MRRTFGVGAVGGALILAGLGGSAIASAVSAPASSAGWRPIFHAQRTASNQLDSVVAVASNA